MTLLDTCRDKHILNHYNADKDEGDKLPMIPFHGLRHTSATLLIASGYGCAHGIGYPGSQRNQHHHEHLQPQPIDRRAGSGEPN